MFRKPCTRFNCRGRPCSLRIGHGVRRNPSHRLVVTTAAESAKPGGKGGGRPGGGIIRLCVTIDEPLLAGTSGNLQRLTGQLL